MDPVTSTPAGWFPDPNMPGQLRYWDGADWTAHVQPGGGGQMAKTSNNAVISLALGIVSFVFCLGFLTGIPAMIMGRKATNEIDYSKGQVDGRGLATAGFWLGLVATVLSALGVILIVGLFVWGASTSVSGETCTTITTEDSFTVDC